MDISQLKPAAVREQTTAAVAASPVRDTGLLILRLTFGLLLASHGAQKLFGWFNGNGISGTGIFFEKVGYRPGRFFAVVAGLSELGGGLLLAAGLLTPLGCAIVIGVMLNAVAAGWEGGLYGGYETALLYAFAGLVVAFTGAGRYALDADRPWQRQGPQWAVAAVALGVGAALLTLLIKDI